MRIVLKYPGVTTRTETSGCSDSAIAGCPSTATGWFDPPSSGRSSTAPVASTPGNRPHPLLYPLEELRLLRRARKLLLAYLHRHRQHVLLIESRIDTLQIPKTANHQPRTDQQHQSTTPPPPPPAPSACLLPPLSASVRPRPCFSASFTSPRVIVIAGINPDSTPVTTASPNVNASTGPLSPIALVCGSCPRSTSAEAQCRSAPPPAPAAPPHNDISTVSVKQLLQSPASRVAPIAERIAISFRRANVRASTRLATFAHAISSTNPTAPSIISNAGRTCPPSPRAAD